MTLDPRTLVKSLKSFFHRTVLDLPHIFYMTQKLKARRKRRVEITNRYPALRWGPSPPHLTQYSNSEGGISIHPSFSDELIGSSNMLFAQYHR